MELFVQFFSIIEQSKFEEVRELEQWDKVLL